MPNWCSNRVTIYSETPKEIETIQEIFSDEKNIFGKIIQNPDWKRLPNEKGEFPKLEQMKNPKGEVIWETYNFPDGKNDDRWFHWNNQNWGTKWDARNVDIEYVDESQIEVTFDTAWSPPEPICAKLREMFEDVSISWFYDEPLMEIAGYL